MTATGQNFTMFQGDDKEVYITNYDENDQPLNITDCTFTWIAYKRPENIVITKTMASGIVIVGNPLNGLIKITLTPTDTTSLLGEYNHETQLIDTNFKKVTTTVGTILIYKTVL